MGQGVLGLVTNPVAGVARFLHYFFLGLSVQAITFSNIGKSELEKLDTKHVRVRPKRRIDVRGQIKVYSQDIAFINELLRLVGEDI